MLAQYGFIGVMAIIAFAFPFIGLAVAWLLRPKRPDPLKNSIYECGVETIGETWVQFRAQYYLFALVFVVFDIEAVFLFPFAVAFNQLTLFAVFEAILFVLILAVGLIYVWRKGALEWQ
ncbi:MAG: NADH-quinone oxidoreductase subunit A [Anaerolineae bacterium]|nr:NADH-quinone oxidoreductase subunit A [Caldilineales bacterium]MCX7853733.1 NADH-quinone oxidoreductase subunit A [Caldilineales bacterium]MDW8269113.1 NADH-quinone oxidoreductase subunit A [Anaerolineae bacterium]